MSLRSPVHDSNASRDPFQLERLAEELVSRESAHPKQPSSRSAVVDDDRDGLVDVDLPLYIPLSHDNPFLTAETFNVEEFLLSRSHTSLPDLRSELREYLSMLKEELVKLINDDYEAFISLSTDLREEGARLDRMKLPLDNLKSQILESKRELRVVQEAIQEKLTKRATLREEKALLHLLIKISESVTRLESLLLISPPPQEAADSPEMNGLRIPPHLRDAEDENMDDRTRGNHAKHLGRVAAEYTQLLYHVSKARQDKCAFVDEIQWRIARIQSTLSSDLDHLFSETLLALIGGKRDGKATEVEKAKWTADLTECFRTYDVLGLWRDAEDILRREVVRPFVKKTIFPGALSSPHSPLVPHTPFKLSNTPSFPISSPQQPPRTPYTPFSAFALKQNPFQSNYSTSPSSPYAHLLDDREDPLARLYNQILRFVERDLCRIMGIAERVSVKSVPSSRVEKLAISPLQPSQDTSKTRGEGFEIMGNVVWAEFGRAIMDNLGGTIFASGRPNEFRNHYEISRAFIRSLEYLAPSTHSVKAMRMHATYSTFDQRWQLPVYFQLRWKEIVGKLEEELSTTRINLSTAADKNFATVQAGAVWAAISACWSAEVFIPELSFKFWKLTLQLLSRYKTWLDQSLQGSEVIPKSAASAALTADKTPGSPSSTPRASTPVLSSEAPSAESIAADNTLLQQYSAIIVDISEMRSNVWTLWREEISMMLPDISEVLDSDRTSAEDALQHMLSTLTSRISPMSSQIVMILTKRCCDALLPVRSIPSQFRAMSNKRFPTEPSYFVSSILRPLKVFFAIGVGEGIGAALKKDFLESYAMDIFESVSQRYVYYLTAMKKTEESLRRLKKGKKTTFSLFGPSASGRDEEGRDEERIQTQMILDVEAFGNDGKSLGLKVEESPSFQSLNRMVHANLTEDPS